MKYILVVWFLSTHGTTSFEHPARDWEQCEIMRAELAFGLEMRTDVVRFSLQCKKRVVELVVTET